VARAASEFISEFIDGVLDNFGGKATPVKVPPIGDGSGYLVGALRFYIEMSSNLVDETILYLFF